MNSTETKKSLLSATLLVLKVILKKIPFQEFVKIYDNFYYYEALDGHEADEMQRKILDEFKIIVRLHEKIQLQVMNRLYLGKANKEKFMEAGRIDEQEAIKRLTEIGEEFDIEKIIKNLQVQ